jgi:prevent-host-death family protein
MCGSAPSFQRAFVDTGTDVAKCPGDLSAAHRGFPTRTGVATLWDVKVATSSRVEVGVRDLKNNLSRYLEQVVSGVEVVVTDRGRPIARLNGIDDVEQDKLAALIDAGVVKPPMSKVRRRPVPLKASGSVSDLVAEQRR